MTNTYNTLNPLGSTNPRDLYDNASNFDDAMNSVEPSFRDRFNKRRETWAGMEQAFSDFLIASGFEFIGDYDADGPLTITRPNQVFSKDGAYWRPAAPPPGPGPSLPYVTVNNWAIDEPKFVVTGDTLLRADLAQNYGVAKGANLVGYAGRTVDTAFRDRVNVADYLVDGAGLPQTQTQAAQAAAVEALLTGKALYFPGGDPWLLSSSISGSGKPIQVVGDGVASTTVVFTAMLGGFSFILNPQLAGTPPQKASISDMTIKSHATVSTPAASFEWSTYQPNAQGSFWASDLNISRKDDGTGSFTAGLELNKCFVGFIDRCVFLGDDTRAGNYAIHLVDSVGIRISDCDGNRYKEGVRIEKVSAGQNEGVLIQNSFFYDVNCGVNAASQCIHINVVNSHININGAGATANIILTTASQCTVTGCLLYVGGSPGDAINQDGVRLANSGNGNRIYGNQMNGLSVARARYGVITTGISSYNSIDGNNINGFAEGVSISGASDTGNRVCYNDFFGNTTDITDVGISTYKDGNTKAGIPISAAHWGGGNFLPGEIASNSNWGGYMRGRLGTSADLAFADNASNVCATIKAGVFAVRTYSKAALPTAVLIAGGTGVIGVNDDVGGFTLAFSDGTNWRRVADRAVIA